MLMILELKHNIYIIHSSRLFFRIGMSTNCVIKFKVSLHICATKILTHTIILIRLPCLA